MPLTPTTKPYNDLFFVPAPYRDGWTSARPDVDGAYFAFDGENVVFVKVVDGVIWNFGKVVDPAKYRKWFGPIK